MLKFTTEQRLSRNRGRLVFNQRQAALAESNGYDDHGFGDGLTGNASAVPIDAWRRIDQRTQLIQRDILAVFNKLAAASQTPVGMGDLVSYYSQVSDSGEVHVSLDGRSQGRGDSAVVTYKGTPVPIFDTRSPFGWRQMEVMKKSPFSLDTTSIANGNRKIAEFLEDMALNGRSDIVVNGATIYGLRTFPQRNTNTHGLTLASATGAQWVSVMKSLVAALIGDNAFGKATVFVNYSDWLYTDTTDYIANYAKTILMRLMEMQQIKEIVPCSKVPANEVIGIANIEMGDWGTVLSGMPLTTRAKTRHDPEDDYVFGSIAAAATQFRSDYDGRAPVAHLTAS